MLDGLEAHKIEAGVELRNKLAEYVLNGSSSVSFLPHSSHASPLQVLN